MAAVSLDDLAQLIAQHEGELKRLKREHQARQSQLEELNRRKQELKAELRTVEARIATLGSPGEAKPATPTPAAPTGPTAATGRAPKKKRPRRGEGPTLAAFIVDIVSQGGGRPVPVSKIAEEVVRTRFPTSSANLTRLLDNRCYELVKKGLLRRAPNRAGLLLARSKSMPATPQPMPQPTRASQTNGKASPAAADGKSLRTILLELLARTSQPLSAADLAKKVLATGYKTQSKDFKNVIWVALGKLNEVQRAPEGGFRLKKRK